MQVPRYMFKMVGADHSSSYKKGYGFPALTKFLFETRYRTFHSISALYNSSCARLFSWHCSTQCVYNSLTEMQQINTVKVPTKQSFDFFKAQNLKIFSQWFQKVLKIPKRQRKISENYWNQLILEEGSIKIDKNQSRIFILLTFIKSKNQSSNF